MLLPIKPSTMVSGVIAKQTKNYTSVPRARKRLYFLVFFLLFLFPLKNAESYTGISYQALNCFILKIWHLLEIQPQSNNTQTKIHTAL